MTDQLPTPGALDRIDAGLQSGNTDRSCAHAFARHAVAGRGNPVYYLESFIPPNKRRLDVSALRAGVA